MKTTSTAILDYKLCSDYKLQSYFPWFVGFDIQDELTLLYSGFPMCLIVTFNVLF